MGSLRSKEPMRNIIFSSIFFTFLIWGFSRLCVFLKWVRETVYSTCRCYSSSASRLSQLHLKDAEWDLYCAESASSTCSHLHLHSILYVSWDGKILHMVKFWHYLWFVIIYQCSCIQKWNRSKLYFKISLYWQSRWTFWQLVSNYNLKPN